MRRGSPATHVVFGVNQTINSANLVLFKALKASQALSSSASRIIIDRIIDGHIGQGLDLYWTQHTGTPSEEDYFTMVDGSKSLIVTGCIMREMLKQGRRNWELVHSSCRIDALRGHQKSRSRREPVDEAHRTLLSGA